MYTEDGYSKLQWKNKPSEDDKSSEKKEKRKNKDLLKKLYKLPNPFKKGWKKDVYKRIMKWRSPKVIEDFHFTKLENLIVYTKGSQRVITSKTKFKTALLNTLSTKDSDAYVYINAYRSLYIKLSLKSYLKLMKVHKIGIDVKVTGIDCDWDGDERIDLWEESHTIDNINDLMDFFMNHRTIQSQINTSLARMSYTTSLEADCKIVVVNLDGSTKTYRGLLGPFMDDYHIPNII